MTEALDKTRSLADEELSYAARQRDILGCRRALKKGADVNTREEGDCPLHWAAFWGDRAVTQILLAAGADRTSKNKHGRIAAVDAQNMGHTDVVRLLFEWGADAVEETRQTSGEIAALEAARDTEGLAAYIAEHRRNFIRRFQCDEAEMALSKMVKEENSAKQELSQAVRAKDIDLIEAAHERAVQYTGLAAKAAKALSKRDDLKANEQEIIDNVHKLMHDARRVGVAKLTAAIESMKRRGKRLAPTVHEAQERMRELEVEWEQMSNDLKEALAAANKAAEEKEEAEERLAELEKALAGLKGIRPIKETVDLVCAGLAELKGDGKGKKK